MVGWLVVGWCQSSLQEVVGLPSSLEVVLAVKEEGVTSAEPRLELRNDVFVRTAVTADNILITVVADYPMVT